MPPFPRPTFDHIYSPATEIQRLRTHKKHLGIPAKSPATLLLATWNIANFGLQERRDADIQLIAEIVKWFDLIAVQEVNERFGDLYRLHQVLGTRYKILFSDPAGNRERMVFVYNGSKVKLLEKVGEVAIPPADIRHIKLPGITRRFDGFDRTPYLAAFQVGQTTFVVVNVHLFFGSEKKPDIERRALEAFALGRWATLRERSPFSYSRNVVVLGDFNLPKVEKGDPIYKALTSKGLHLPSDSSRIGSTLSGDKQYDQVAFFPGETKERFTGRMGVCDFDTAVLRAYASQVSRKSYEAYLKYHLSDHRPMWAEFKIA
jgi:endonuclease/exonuclease/phosphatase family metal-dependent hydrolase